MEVSREHNGPAILGGSASQVVVNDRLPVPRSLLAPLWLALGAAAFFMLAATVLGVTRPGYDAWHQAVSALSLGPGGWRQGVNFVLLGVALLVTVPAWRRILAGGPGARAYPALTALAGASFVVVAFVPQDPAPGYDPMQLALGKPTLVGLVHLALAGVAAGSSIAGLLVMANRCSGDPHWPGWTSYTSVMAVLTIMCVVIYAVWSTKPTGFAGTFERLAVLIPLVWGISFVRRLSSGTPFMRVIDAQSG